MKKTIVLIFLTLMGMNLQAGRLAEVYNPEFEIDGNPTMKKVEAAIKKALIGRRWMVKKSDRGEIHATLKVRSHTAKIIIHYSRSKVRFEYVSSVNLDYRVKKGTPMIHRNYNNWVTYLERDIMNTLI